MRKIVLFLLILVSSNNLICQQNVLFLLPGETSYVASRTYNLFKEMYIGSVYWIDLNKATSKDVENYSNIVKFEEFSENNLLTIKASFYLGNSTSTYTKRFNLLNNRNFRKYATELALEIMNELDPDYIKEIKEAVEDI